MRIYFIIAICVIMISGCQQSANSNEPSDSTNIQLENLSPTIDVQSGYPAQNTSNAYPGSQNYPTNIIKSTPHPIIDPSLPISTPQSGNATLTGYVVNEATGLPVPSLSVSLAKIHRNEQGDGAFALEGASSPTTLTDGNGRFILGDIEPVDYVIVLGNVEVNNYQIITTPSGKAKIWSIIPNQINDIDRLEYNSE